jgi:hypothetical protein
MITGVVQRAGGLKISLLYKKLSFQQQHWGAWRGEKVEFKPCGCWRGEQNANESIYRAHGIGGLLLPASRRMLIQLHESIFWLFPTHAPPPQSHRVTSAARKLAYNCNRPSYQWPLTWHETQRTMRLQCYRRLTGRYLLRISVYFILFVVLFNGVVNISDYIVSTDPRRRDMEGNAFDIIILIRHLYGRAWGKHWRMYVRLEDFTAVTMKNVVFWDIKTQFVSQRRHITSPLHSPAG